MLYSLSLVVYRNEVGISRSAVSRASKLEVFIVQLQSLKAVFVSQSLLATVIVLHPEPG